MTELEKLERELQNVNYTIDNFRTNEAYNPNLQQYKDRKYQLVRQINNLKRAKP